MTAATSHIPVMLTEVVDALGLRDGGLYVDATFGAGGYARAILGAAETRLIGIDRDPRARKPAEAVRACYPGRFIFAQGRFGDLDAILEQMSAEEVAGIVFDLGVSSMQIDQPARGFSFRADGPLDMRMGEDGPSAADVVARLDARALAAIFRVYGEERHARRAAEAIVAAQAEEPITTTARLAQIVERAVGPGDGRIHPATRVFQALRIYVNAELTEIERALYAAEQRLAPGGRLVVVSFHSLEDRIVKQFLRARSGRAPQGSRHAPAPAETAPPSFREIHATPLRPAAAETEENPRARSAKLRAAVRTDAAPMALGPALAPDPGAPDLEETSR